MTNDFTHELLLIRQRRLQHLETQRATKGIDTEYQIVAEIEQIRAEIERLKHYSHIYRLSREVRDDERPQPMLGLIALVSPEDIQAGMPSLKQAAFDAIYYHRSSLRICWLIASRGKRSSLATATWLAGYCAQKKIVAQIWQIQNELSVEETFKTVQLIYQQEFVAAQLQAKEVIADITGATKPMSIGVFLACQGVMPVQYMVRPENEERSVPFLIRDTSGEQTS